MITISAEAMGLFTIPEMACGEAGDPHDGADGGRIVRGIDLVPHEDWAK